MVIRWEHIENIANWKCMKNIINIQPKIYIELKKYIEIKNYKMKI